MTKVNSEHSCGSFKTGSEQREEYSPVPEDVEDGEMLVKEKKYSKEGKMAIVNKITVSMKNLQREESKGSYSRIRNYAWSGHIAF